MLSHRSRRVALSIGERLYRLAGITAVQIGDYPLQPRPRWGHGLPPHPQLATKLEGQRTEFSALLDAFFNHRDTLHAIPYTPDPSSSTRPFWDNIWFSALDAASLVALLLDRAPRLYLEIGSGHSTMFARYAISAGGLPTKITSLDPEPRVAIDPLCDEVVRKPLEACDLSTFESLEPGDILFFDGSHRIFTNSDVTTFFLDVLPRLPSRVLVHVHDIFWPWDYPPNWKEHFYSEQYLLGALLLAGDAQFRVLLPNFFVCQDPELSSIARNLFRADQGRHDIPFLYPGVPGNVPGVSFWLETSMA